MYHFLRTLSFLLVFMGALNAEKLKIICPKTHILLTVEIPKNRDERRKGLMFRESLSSHAGMLFLFPDFQTFSPVMWMKNTRIPLDMIFADHEGKILGIFENTRPYSEDPIGPVKGTAQILEIKGGLVKKHGITQACQIQREPSDSH